MTTPQTCVFVESKPFSTNTQKEITINFTPWTHTCRVWGKGVRLAGDSECLFCGAQPPTQPTDQESTHDAY